MFSTFFSSVLSNNSPHFNESYLRSLPQFELNITQLSFSENDVLVKLKSIDDSKGPGPDSLPPSVVKACAASLALPLSIIFNRSLTEACFPAVWKSAAIKPIHKSGSIHDVENYRGVAILSCIPKILERMVHDVLHLTTKNIISFDQHGFMTQRSTTTNLLSYVSTLVNKIEKRQQVDAIYVDLSKAFDKVPHSLAVEKFKRMGFPDWLVKWLLSYLTGRSSYVKIGSVYSSSFEVRSGVPQGSILGPMLFNLFINDLCEQLKSTKCLFADDLKFYRPVTTIVDCCALQMDIDSLLTWCSLNGMEANVNKCCVISFSRARSLLSYNYTMGEAHLKRSSTVKDLGIIIDSKLKFTEHISTITAKAFATLGVNDD